MIRPFCVAALAVFTVMLSPLCRGALAAESQQVDGIAAIVNGDVITFSQVRSVSGPRERLLVSQFKGEELAKQIKTAREAALKDLIDRQLILVRRLILIMQVLPFGKRRRQQLLGKLKLLLDLFRSSRINIGEDVERNTPGAGAIGQKTAAFGKVRVIGPCI